MTSSIEVDDHICSAPETIPVRMLRHLKLKKLLASKAPAVQTRLVLPAAGLYGYKNASNRFGTNSTIVAITEIGRIWALRRDRPRIGVGDISKQGGGTLSGHKSHKKGRDVDIDMMRNNKMETDSGRITYKSPNYSKDLTQELVDLIHVNGKAGIIIVFFNDPKILGVNWYSNHDNHLHIRFALPGELPNFPTVEKGLYSSAVRELQRRLNFWLLSSKSTDTPLTIDGGFGNITEKRLSEFLEASGMARVPRVNAGVWNALPVA